MKSVEDSRASRKVLIWLLILNLVMRATWMLLVQPKQVADFEWYFTHATQMAQGQGYIWGGHYTAYWPIGWPFILSLLFRMTGAHVATGLIANALFSIGIVLLVYAIALLLFQSQRVAAAAAFGYTLLPSQIEWNAVLGSEESFTFFLMLSLYLYLRATRQPKVNWGLLLAGGAVMGLASDIRPVTLLFPVFILIYELLLHQPQWRRAVSRTVGFGLFMIVTVLPVTIRNYITMHHWIVVSTNGGVNLWQGTMTNGGYFWSWNPAINPLLQSKGNEILQNQIGEQVAFQHILQNPWLTLLNGFVKIYDLYKNDVNGGWYTIHLVDPGIQNGVNQFTTYAYWLFMIFALVGLVKYFWWPRKVWSVRVLPVVFLLYYTLLFLFFPAWDRFRYPIMPIYALYLGLGWTVMWDWLSWRLGGRKGSPRKITPPVTTERMASHAIPDGD